MTDRELLELAAKATGNRVDKWISLGGDTPRENVEVAIFEDGVTYFQPLHENPFTDCMGDALWLAVKLGLFVHCENDMLRTQAGMGPLPGLKSVAHGADPYAATRRAIVRAAAEIGKAMP